MEIVKPEEFEQAIQKLEASLCGLPDDPPAFDTEKEINDLRDAETEAARFWRDVESTVQNHLGRCEVTQPSIGLTDSFDAVNMIAATPDSGQPIVTLRLEYQANGELLITSSYSVAEEEYLFLAGSIATINDISIAASRITARITYSAVFRHQIDHRSESMVTAGGTVPGAHRKKRNQMQDISKDMSEYEELLMRLRERPEWTVRDTIHCPQEHTEREDSQKYRPDGGDSVHCISCGAVPVQGHTIRYDGWRGNLMFCEPCLARVRQAIEEGKTIWEITADDLSKQDSRPSN